MDSNNSDPNVPKNDPKDLDLSDDEERFEDDILSGEIRDNNESFVASNNADDSQQSRKSGNIGQRKRTYGTAFPCEYCPYSYKVKVNLQAHMASNHKEKFINSGDFKCDFVDCDNAFSTEMGLNVHKSKHKRRSNVESKKAESSSVRNKRTILRPKRLLSDDDEDGNEKKKEQDKKDDSPDDLHTCPQCLKTFKNNLYLKFHMEVYHKTKENIYCKKCGEICVDFDGLEEHLKKYKCDLESPEDELCSTGLGEGIPANEPISPFTKSLYSQSFYKNEGDRPSTSAVSRSFTVPSAQLSAISSIRRVHEAGRQSSERTPNIDHSIEKSVLPLSTAVYSRSKENSTEFMVIWCNYLEDDLLTSVSLVPSRAIICAENIDFIKMSEKHKNMLKDANVYSFVIPKSADLYSPWSIISFGKNLFPSDLNNKIFKNIEDVEKIFIKKAKENGMELISMIRYNKDDFYATLVEKLTVKILVLNCPK